MGDSGCPSPKTILQYTEGRLETAEATALKQHLDSCSECSRLVQVSVAGQLGVRSPGTADTVAIDDEANRRVDASFQVGSDLTTPDAWTTRRKQKDAPVFAEGQHLGKYEILKLLGKGGMGQVFLARHTKLDRTVAIKTLTQAHLALPESLERFEREMKAVARLDHPNIVRAYDADETDGVHYFVMEYLEGNCVAQILKTSEPMPVARACELAQQVAVGLSHIHQHNLIHRDIKPANLIVTPDGTVKILDLGLALLNDNTLRMSDLTTSGLVIGTPDFMACEQLEDMRSVDIRADIYSLGATLYALLAGHGPFAGNSYQSTLKKIAAMATEVAAPITNHRTDIPSGLEVVIDKMLQREADDRYQSPDEVVAALQPFVKQNPGAAFAVPASKPKKRIAFMAAIVMAMVGSAACLWNVRPDNDQVQPFFGKTEIGVKPETVEFSPADVELSDPLPKLKNVAAKMADDLMDGKREAALKYLQAGSDNTLRSYLIQALSERELTAELVLDLSSSVRTNCTRSGLFLALAESGVGIDEQQKDRLLDIYRNDRDASVHSAVELLLRRKGFAEELEAADRILQQRLQPAAGWFETLTGHTMIIVPGPVSCFLGSPADEVGRSTVDPLHDESLRDVTIDYSFAVSAREVSHGQVHFSQPEYWKEKAPHIPETSFGMCYWNQAAEYCNYLSALEGLPRSEFCYEKVDNDEEFRIKPNAVEHSGYRLPTDEEWEIIARAGSLTSRHFGRDAGLLSKYCFGNDSAARHARVSGLLLPNAMGFYDTLGNVSEWIHEAIPDGPRGLAYRLRGGSCWTGISGIRAAARYYIEWRDAKNRYGFRIARTIRPQQSRSASYRIYASSVVDGDSSTEAEPVQLSSDSPLCLGTWKRQDDSRSRTFWFQNTSSETLIVSSDRVRGKFEFVEPKTVEVLPGNHAEFSLRAQSDCLGPRGGKAQLKVLGPSVNEKAVIRVCSNVYGAMCQLAEADVDTQPSEFAFGGLPVNSALQHRFTVFNSGNLPLQISKVVAPEGFTVLESPRQIQLFDYGHIVVRTDAAVESVHEGDLEIYSNDGAQPVVRLRLSSNVVRGPVSSLGVYRSGVWLFDHNHDGVADEEIMFGGPDSHPVTGDWNGDGICDLAVVDPVAGGLSEWKFYLRGNDDQMDSLICGPSGCIPLSSNYLHTDRDEPVTVTREVNSNLDWAFYSDGELARQTKTTAQYGCVCTGDWDGDMRDDIVSVVNHNGKHRWTIVCADKTHQLDSFGLMDDFPVFGDWDGDGKCEPGIVRMDSQGRAEWQFDISRTGELPERELIFGQRDDHIVVLSARTE